MTDADTDLATGATVGGADDRLGWSGRVLALVCIVVLAVNLRPTAIAISPVLGDLRADLGLNGALAGLLTTLPLLCFAGFGALAPGLAARLGVHRTALLALVAITVGQAVRVAVPQVAVFLPASALALGGMAVGNVLLPSVVRRHFGDRIGLVTGIYSLMLGTGVALASLLSAPIAAATGSWRWSLAVWVGTAALATLPWIELSRRDGGDPSAVSARPAVRLGQVARTRIGWVLALFFAVQSFHAYSVFGWLPTIYADGGLTSTQAGLMLTLTTGLGLPLAFWVPHYVATARRPQWLLITIPTLGLVAFVGLMTAPTTVPWLWAVLLCVGLSGFPAYLSLVGLRARTSSGTAALSGFSQSVGYLFAGLGPFLMGVLSEATGGWHTPLIVLAVLCPLLCVLGLLATRRVYVEDQLPG